LALRLRGFLEQISLVSDVDGLDASQGSVTLMTLHAAKGLEFPVVAMIGVEDGLLPHERSQGGEKDIEEERRLCFVGITRAQRFLLLTHTRVRSVFGKTLPAIPSRFLNELPDDQIECVDISNQNNESFADDDEDEQDDGDEIEVHAAPPRAPERQREGAWPPGTWVRHQSLGVGRLVKITGVGDQAKAQVAFSTGGVKTLLLQYANLQRIET
jgi:DNA helicase-2/ATP-dependent DNA helicase PcrA